MKAMKLLGKLLLCIAGIVVALVLALPLWVGPVVKSAANAIVPKKTGTAFNLGAFALNPYTGKLAVGDVQLCNPEGFEPMSAASLGSLAVVVDTTSLLGDVILVRDIELRDVFVSYVMNGRGENNFDTIKKNATGNEEVKANGKGEPKNATQPAQPAQPSQSAKSSKKVVIDHLLIANVRVQIGPVVVPMPEIELTGIGRKDGGVTMQEAWQQIHEQIMNDLNRIGVDVNGLMKGLGKVNVNNVLKIVDAAKKVDVKSVTDAVNASAAILNATTGKTTDAVTGTSTKIIDATGKTTDRAVQKVNKQVEKASEAINTIKSLF